MTKRNREYIDFLKERFDEYKYIEFISDLLNLSLRSSLLFAIIICGATNAAISNTAFPNITLSSRYVAKPTTGFPLKFDSLVFLL